MACAFAVSNACPTQPGAVVVQAQGEQRHQEYKDREAKREELALLFDRDSANPVHRCSAPSGKSTARNDYSTERAFAPSESADRAIVPSVSTQASIVPSVEDGKILHKCCTLSEE